MIFRGNCYTSGKDRTCGLEFIMKTVDQSCDWVADEGHQFTIERLVHESDFSIVSIDLHIISQPVASRE